MYKSCMCLKINVLTCPRIHYLPVDHLCLKLLKLIGLFLRLYFLRLSFVKLQLLGSYGFRVKHVQVLLVCLGCLIFPINLAQLLCSSKALLLQ